MPQGLLDKSRNGTRRHHARAIAQASGEEEGATFQPRPPLSLRNAHEAVGEAASISVESRDLTAWVDTASKRSLVIAGTCSRRVQYCHRSILRAHKSVIHTEVVIVPTDDLPRRVDGDGKGPCTARRGRRRHRIKGDKAARLKTVRRIDPEVYDATLKGKATLEYATREGELHQAIELFQRAIDRDPTYAPAWAGLEEATWWLAGTGFEYVDPAEVRDKAIASADKALELDGTLPDAHKARAAIALDAEWDVANAQQHFEKALELRPGYAAAHTAYGQMLSGEPLPRFDEGRLHIDRGRELDPLSPWNDINLLAWWLFQGRPERAFEEGERARQRNPTLWVIPWQMGFAQLLLGQPSQAVPEFEAALKLLQPQRPASVLAPLGLAYGLAGRRADALKILAELEQASQKRYISPYYLAVAYSGLGRMDEAFSLLDQALEQRTPWLVCSTPYAPLSIALRRDPRWKPFIDRLRRLVRLPPGTPDPYS